MHSQRVQMSNVFHGLNATISIAISGSVIVTMKPILKNQKDRWIQGRVGFHVVDREDTSQVGIHRNCIDSNFRREWSHRVISLPEQPATILANAMRPYIVKQKMRKSLFG